MKVIKSPNGDKCPKCGKVMELHIKEKGTIREKNRKQNYFFKFTGVCECGYILNYNEAKVTPNDSDYDEWFKKQESVLF